MDNAGGEKTQRAARISRSPGAFARSLALRFQERRRGKEPGRERERVASKGTKRETEGEREEEEESKRVYA